MYSSKIQPCSRWGLNKRREEGLLGVRLSRGPGHYPFKSLLSMLMYFMLGRAELFLEETAKFLKELATMFNKAKHI